MIVLISCLELHQVILLSGHLNPFCTDGAFDLFHLVSVTFSYSNGSPQVFARCSFDTVRAMVPGVPCRSPRGALGSFWTEESVVPCDVFAVSSPSCLFLSQNSQFC